MKPTVTPASRLPSSSILSTLHSSGKRHLVITGRRGSGKTTLLRALFPTPCPGLTTWAEPQKAVYLQDNLTGACTQIGAFDPTLPGPCRQMRPLPEGFLSLGVAALRRCAESDGEWVTIDEIGYLEEGCEAYLNALRGLFAQKRVACVVRRQALPFLQDREDVLIIDLDDPFGAVGCVIMASGQSRRFGSNKLLADFGGQPMLGCVLDATEGLFARCVAVTRSAEIAALCEARGVRTILHALPHRSDTVRLGLQAVGDAERCLFCAGDQPLLRRETLVALALAAKAVPDAIWRPACDGVPGAPVVFPRWAFEELMMLPEGAGGSAVIARYPESVRTLEVQDARELRDVDTPAALQELLKAL